MAVSAYDKKNLSTAQQNEINRVTAAAQSGSMSWADAHNAAEAVRSSAGYSGGPLGNSYTTAGNSSSTTPRGSFSSTPTVATPSSKAAATTPTVATGTDYSQQIINLLTSGQSYSDTQLNALVNARQAKINSDPTKYANVTSTADLIAKYLPQAQLTQTTNIENAQIQNLIKTLQGLGTNGISTMDYSDAQNQASSQLNPQYAQAAKTLSNLLDLDMEKRGIYNSPLASGIMTEKQSQLTDEKAQAIATLAGTIQQNNNSLSLQQAQLQSDTLSNLLSQLIGKQVSTAELTGTYNGINTLAKDQYETNTKLSEAELTGKYNGQTTLAALNQKISQALASVELLGKVSTQEQATMLGVPIGTSTQAAKQAAAELQENIRQFNADYSLHQAQLSASRAASSASSSAQKFSNAMQVWETTGTAPSGILQSYGVAAGTAYSSEYARSAQGKLDELNAQAQVNDAEEELQFQNRATNFMKNYGVDRNTAEACLLTIGSANTLSDAKKYLSANSTTLQSGGVSTAAALKALTKYYDTYGKVKQVTGSTFDFSATSGLPSLDSLLS
jgi:hypothetical protein